MQYKNGVVRIGEVFYNGLWHNVGIGAEMMFVNDVVDEVYEHFGLGEGTVTCGIEGWHSRTSLHPKGKAQDYRTWGLDGKQLSRQDKMEIANMIRLKLGPDFDVIIEKDHIHVEFDKK